MGKPIEVRRRGLSAAVLRMLGAMVVSLLFTFTYGALAAKSRRAESILIPEVHPVSTGHWR